MADDVLQGAQFAILPDGSLIARRFIRQSEASHKGNPLELDAEGVTYADGAFYVVGSHGRPRQQAGKNERTLAARARATRHLFRIRVDPKTIDLERGDVAGAPEVTGTNALGRILAEIARNRPPSTTSPSRRED